MQKLFHEDNPVIIVLTHMFDLMLLNLLVVLASIPVITIGAALSAMHAVLVQGIEMKQGDIVKRFWGAFKSNFFHATCIWLILMGMLTAAVCFLLQLGSGTFLLGVLGILFMLLTASIFCYVFPLQARYENPVLRTMQNALMLALGNIPQTGAMLAMIIVFGFFFWNHWEKLLPFFFLFGISAPGWLSMKLYLPVFEKCKKES